ncbi:MAG: tRNA pseudouridine(38-40) synthase TruA [Burkholderiales bacterium]
MRIALGLEYDGSGFCGWQTQPRGCAIQDHLETALAAIAKKKITTVCAGRTDAGVHALRQVVHFDTDAARPLTAWVRGVNSRLPKTIAVTWAAKVAGDFHARNSALERCYRYVLLNHPVRPALFDKRMGWTHHPLDLHSMRQATQHLVGTHDFSAFRAQECQAASPVKALRSAEITQNGNLFFFEFAARSFLYHMVRNLVGSLIQVGAGKRPPDWMGEVLRSRDRKLAAPTFQPDGLYLANITYDGKWGLPANPRL